MIRQIDAGITTLVIVFGLIHHFLWRVLIAISRRPAIQLPICAAAEFQKLVPVLFHEEQQPPDGCLLLDLRCSKTPAADVDVQTAGACLMGAIAKGNRLFHDLFPRKMSQMILRCCRMADDFKAVIQTPIMLAIEVLRITVANGQNFFGIAGKLTALVDLQLHAEKSLSCSIKVQLRTIIIVVNDLILQDMIAAFTVRIVVIVQIVRLAV